MKIVYTRSSTIYDDSRATKELYSLLNEGYNVIVLGWDRNGLADKSCNELFSKYGRQIELFFYSEPTGHNILQKAVSRKKWSSWLQNRLHNISDIDVIHACDYDTGSTVRRFARKNNIKYIYDIFDYYVDAHQIPSIFKPIIERDEIRTINDSYVTIICTEERRKQIEKSNPRKVVIIYNSPEVEKTESCEEIYDYVYCGSLYEGRLINEIMNEYRNNHCYEFVIAGYGEYQEKAKKLSNDYEEFTFLGSIPYSEVLKIEKKSKVISAIYNPAIRNHQLCAPNKFYEALALGKPVIVCRGTGIDIVVEREKVGLSIGYEVNEFYQALSFLCDNEPIRKEMGKKARKLYERDYKWSNMKERLISIYNEIKGENNNI